MEAEVPKHTRLCIAGAGTMGRGIAHAALTAGFEVRLYDVDPAAREAALPAVTRTLDRALAKGKLDPATREDCAERLHVCDSLEQAARGADLVIETVVENPAVKAAVLAELAPFLDADTVVASNTSSLSISGLAPHSGRPDRFVGMHFFNPPYALRLLELIEGRETSSETLTRCRAWAEAMKRVLVEVKDSPGFATSRLGIALGNEAMRMVEAGVARPKDIDTAMRAGYGHPMGPIELTDHVGLDVRLAITEYLHGELGTDTFEPPAMLRRLVAEGRVGKKSGHGFYRWVEGKPVEDEG